MIPRLGPVQIGRPAKVLARDDRPLPDAAYEVMPVAGHAPWLDDLDHCAAVTDAFLRRGS